MQERVGSPSRRYLEDGTHVVCAALRGCAVEILLRIHDHPPKRSQAVAVLHKFMQDRFRTVLGDLEYCPVSIGANGAAEAGCAVKVALAVQQESSGGATEAKALTRPDKGRRSP